MALLTGANAYAAIQAQADRLMTNATSNASGVSMMTRLSTPTAPTSRSRLWM